ncbi:MAG: hypothetical protein GX428_00290, partial [Candidatus Atribacteria bacterium]|nr:hypothetical protein [Candidatus Atribacteria bacterium]
MGYKEYFGEKEDYLFISPELESKYNQAYNIIKVYFNKPYRFIVSPYENICDDLFCAFLKQQLGELPDQESVSILVACAYFEEINPSTPQRVSSAAELLNSYDPNLETMIDVFGFINKDYFKEGEKEGGEIHNLSGVVNHTTVLLQIAEEMYKGRLGSRDTIPVIANISQRVLTPLVGLCQQHPDIVNNTDSGQDATNQAIKKLSAQYEGFVSEILKQQQNNVTPSLLEQLLIPSIYFADRSAETTNLGELLCITSNGKALIDLVKEKPELKEMIVDFILRADFTSVESLTAINHLLYKLPASEKEGPIMKAAITKALDLEFKYYCENKKDSNRGWEGEEGQKKKAELKELLKGIWKRVTYSFVGLKIPIDEEMICKLAVLESLDWYAKTFKGKPEIDEGQHQGFAHEILQASDDVQKLLIKMIEDFDGFLWYLIGDKLYTEKRDYFVHELYLLLKTYNPDLLQAQVNGVKLGVGLLMESYPIINRDSLSSNVISKYPIVTDLLGFFDNDISKLLEYLDGLGHDNFRNMTAILIKGWAIDRNDPEYRKFINEKWEKGFTDVNKQGYIHDVFVENRSQISDLIRWLELLAPKGDYLSSETMKTYGLWLADLVYQISTKDNYDSERKKELLKKDSIFES